MPITSAKASENEGSFGNEVRTIEFPNDVHTLAWSHNGRYLAVSNTAGNRVWLYDLDKNEIRWTVKKGGGIHQGLAFSAGDRFVVTAPINGAGGQRWEATIGLVDVETGEAHNLVEPLPMTAEGKVADINDAMGLAASADGKAVVALIGNRGRIYVYDTTTWQIRHHIGPILTEHRGSTLGGGPLAIDPGRDLVVYADHRGAAEHGVVDTWRLLTNTRLNSFPAYEVGMRRMILDPLTGTLFTGSNADIIGVPDPTQPGHMLEKQDDPLTAVRAWNPMTGERVQTYEGPGMGVAALSLSPNGRYLAATKGGGLIPAYLIAWDAKTGARLAVRDFGKDHWVFALAFSPDGQRLAYGLDDEIYILELDPDLFR